jgi:DNA-binding NarL/FixJ family response regulator
VASEGQHAVVILYKHALLGEGIATYLRAQVGVEATVASARDPQAVTSALALGPAVVIFESSDPFQQFDLTTLAPQAVLIDVSTVITRGSVLSPGVAGLEQILQAVRDSGTVASPVQSHPVPADLYRKSTVRRMGSPQ